ncbi:MAG: hypothetical protein KDI75_08925 [Xanthomonadales bacterium]|nr:hypothetical protein [Xanthomonadales bacterium]
MSSRILPMALLPAFLLLPLLAAGGTQPASVFMDGFETRCGPLLYGESFDVAAGQWPGPWQELADSAAVADVIAGEARLRPVPTGNPYPLARMFADVPTSDVDVRFRLRMADATRSGVGFYVRQNGGHMLNTVPTGSGYGVFVEGGFRGQAGIGLWREENGNEIPFAHSASGLLDPHADVDYEVRFQVSQQDASTTALRARLWPSGEPEPAVWHVEGSDDQFSLQGISGGIALDSYDHQPGHVTPAHTFVDDIKVRGLCEPF